MVDDCSSAFLIDSPPPGTRTRPALSKHPSGFNPSMAHMCHDLPWAVGDNDCRGTVLTPLIVQRDDPALPFPPRSEEQAAVRGADRLEVAELVLGCEAVVVGLPYPRSPARAEKSVWLVLGGSPRLRQNSLPRTG